VSYLIDDLLPENVVHLLGGPSGAGKTRWLINSLIEWRKGRPVLDKPSHPGKWLYISSDRGADEVNRMLERMQVDKSLVPLIPAFGKDYKNINEIMDIIVREKPKLTVIEAFGSFLDSNSKKEVKAYLNRCKRFCDEAQTTIIGVVESPKMTPNKFYENPRQRISGVADWGHFASTIMIAEFENPKNPNGARRLWICPRDYPSVERLFTFDFHGRPVLSNPDEIIVPEIVR